MAHRIEHNRRRPAPPPNRDARGDMRIERSVQPPQRRRSRKKEQEPELHRFEGKDRKRRQAEVQEAQQAFEEQLRSEHGSRRIPDRESRERSNQKKQVRKQLLLRVFAVLGVLAVLGLLAYTLLRVKHIRVEGGTWLPEERVISLSGISEGDGVLQLNKAQIKERIEQDPHYVFEGYRYTFPSTITLMVTERQEVAQFAFANTYVTVDPEGRVLGHIDDDQGPTLPVVTGLRVEEFVLGAPVHSNDTYKEEVLRNVMQALGPRAFHKQVISIDVSDVNQVWMTMDSEVQVCLGRSEQLEKKLDWLETILEVVEQEGYTGGSIDLTSTLAPVYTPDTSGQTEEAPAA